MYMQLNDMFFNTVFTLKDQKKLKHTVQNYDEGLNSIGNNKPRVLRYCSGAAAKYS
jgi:hypothetical protein